MLGEKRTHQAYLVSILYYNENVSFNVVDPAIFECRSMNGMGVCVLPLM